MKFRVNKADNEYISKETVRVSSCYQLKAFTAPTKLFNSAAIGIKLKELITDGWTYFM
jgi:hypothetical protein